MQSKRQRQGKTFTLQVEVPVGSETEVNVPAASVGDVFESGSLAAMALGLKYLGKRAHTEVYCVGNGVYRFVTR